MARPQSLRGRWNDIWLISHESCHIILKNQIQIMPVNNRKRSSFTWSVRTYPILGSRDPDTAWNTTEKGWLMKIIWKSLSVWVCEMKLYGAIFAKKPYGSILRELYRKIYTGPMVNLAHRKEKEEMKTINLRIKISIDVVDVFWAVIHNDFSFECFRIWSI